MGGKGDAKGTAAGFSSTPEASREFTGKADQYVPIFDNVQRNYKEYRKRCELCRVKMELSGRARETIFNIITLLSGKAWDLVDDIPMDVLQGTDGFTRVFERLDRGFKFEALTELPEDFETFFVRLHRKPQQTLQEYTVEFSKAERQLRTTHGVELPEKVRAWWFLRKSGIQKEQRQLVLTNVGADNLTVDGIQKAMNFPEAPRWNRTKDHVYYEECRGLLGRWLG